VKKSSIVRSGRFPLQGLGVRVEMNLTLKVPSKNYDQIFPLENLKNLNKRNIHAATLIISKITRN
jgi:hypothetical protein